MARGKPKGSTSAPRSAATAVLATIDKSIDKHVADLALAWESLVGNGNAPAEAEEIGRLIADLQDWTRLARRASRLRE